MFSQVQAVIACQCCTASNSQPVNEGFSHNLCFVYPVIFFSFYMFLSTVLVWGIPRLCPVYLLSIILLDI